MHILWYCNIRVGKQSVNIWVVTGILWMYYYRPHKSDTQRVTAAALCNQSTFPCHGCSLCILRSASSFGSTSSLCTACIGVRERLSLEVCSPCAAMGRGSGMAAAVLLAAMVLCVCVHGTEGLVCTKDFKEKGCNKTISDLFTVDMFEAMFNHRNDRVAHAQSFWTYDGFMAAAAMFEKDGFGSVGGDDLQKRELAAFFAHVAHETSCGWSGAKDGPYAWGLCYNEELAPEKDYCKTGDLMYPCAAGAGYYGRGAFPLYWNYNYGPTGVALKQDLLHHPELLSKNETIAWQAAIWYWMTPAKTRPSPHQIMVGKWTPSKEDTLASRKTGFGMTINVKASDVECGHGEDPRMQSRISHYLYFLTSYFGVDDPGSNLDCSLQGVIPLAYASV